jgi:hypothetical protein
MRKATLVAATVALAAMLPAAVFAATDGTAAAGSNSVGTTSAGETSAGKTGERLATVAGARPPLPGLPGADGLGARTDAPRPVHFDGPGAPPPPPWMVPGGRRGPGHGDRLPARGPMERPQPAMLAATLLAAAETAVGIRADQLDAWRAFSSALVALLEPPAPPPPPAGDDDGKRDPFARVEWLAGEVAERGRRAEAVEEAIEALRPVLTEEQTERLAAFEARLGPHGRFPPLPPFAGGWHPDASPPTPAPDLMPPADPEGDAPPPRPPGD